MEKQKVSTKKNMAISEVTGLLRDFADGLDNGKLILERDGNILELSIPSEVEAKVIGQRKEGREKFSLELSWRQADDRTSIKINPESISDDKGDEGADEESQTDNLVA
ncbi:MAG: amphi-Trp domain-containing protein [Thermodesulfobacteriota bacterium]|nr:amphi-Trp domain-containing protein [Thermodesulfobacteriota bacterium]